MSLSMNRIHGLTIGLILMLSSKTVEANLVCYDLDSLVYLSEEIVESRIARSYSSNGWDVTEVKVARVYRGTIARGGTIRVQGLCGYKKPKPERLDRNPVALQDGDRLILFLANARSTLPAKMSEGKDIYQPVRSGVKMVFDGRVVGFSQLSNPGPTVLETDSCVVGACPTPEAFGQQLSETIVKTKKFAARLDAAVASKDSAWFMETLRERARLRCLQPNRYYRDHIAELACSGLADLHDPNLLEKALPFDQWGIIAVGFGTPAGRDYILAALQDPKQPRERKLRLARVVQYADYVYRSRLENIKAGGWQIVGKPGVRNDGYITRIARSVLANSTDEEICLALTRSINFFGRTIVQGHQDDARADIVQALSVLKQVYETCKSEALRYEIEAATANVSRELYDRLGPSGGPIISMMIPADPTKFAVPKERSLPFYFNYWVISGGPYAASVVLQNRGAGEKFVIPASDMPDFDRDGAAWQGGWQGGGSASVPLPKKLPKGKYRVYLQFTEDNRVVGVGHFFDTEL